VLVRERRLSTSAAMPMETRHVLGDLWRFAVAGSMLIIDDDVCVRCGHCAWACATAHEDGVSRLVRRGEKVAVRDATDGSLRALVVPGGCQQCKHPACMPVCPTGAIGRDPRGQIFVREDLCVGCGQCERACPWGSVQMAPRPVRAKSSLPVLGSAEGESPAVVPSSTALVAVKCDACRDIEGGPACVRACPVDAIARVEPLASMVDVRRAVAERAPRRSLPRPRPAWPWVLGAAAVAAAVARMPVVTWEARLATGLLAGVLVAALAGYAALKRVVLPRLARRSTARPYAIAHLATGVLAVGVVAAHAGTHIRANAAGALLLAFAVASVTGVLATIAYRFLPRALGRVEREARMPEDLPARSRDLDERAFGALTGRSDATKAVYARMLSPYARAPLGPLWLVLSRRTLGAEEARLRARLDRVLGARASRLDGLDDLVRLVVERRAVGAQRVLQGLLRSWVPVHVVSMAIAVVLLCVHVACVVGLR
jgi:Fe-S-cluster-containing dehydrogenase component